MLEINKWIWWRFKCSQLGRGTTCKIWSIWSLISIRRERKQCDDSSIVCTWLEEGKRCNHKCPKIFSSNYVLDFHTVSYRGWISKISNIYSFPITITKQLSFRMNVNFSVLRYMRNVKNEKGIFNLPVNQINW